MYYITKIHSCLGINLWYWWCPSDCFLDFLCNINVFGVKHHICSFIHYFSSKVYQFDIKTSNVGDVALVTLEGSLTRMFICMYMPLNINDMYMMILHVNVDV